MHRDLLTKNKNGQYSFIHINRVHIIT